MSFKRTTFLLILIVSSFFQVGSLRATKYAGEFLNMGVGARALGMGGAFVAMANDASATYWNPAGLVQLSEPEIAIMHSERFAGIVKYDWLSYVHPQQTDVGSSCFGMSLIRLGVDDIPITTLRHEDQPFDPVNNRPEVKRWASDAEYALFITYARSVNATISYGGNVKVLRRSVDEYSAWGLGVDMGLFVTPVDRLKLGINLQDATTTLVAWDTGTRESISPTLKIGGAYLLGLNIFRGYVTPAIDVDIRFERRKYASEFHWGDVSADIRFGAEYWFRNLFALRMGSDDIGRFSAGTGFRFGQMGLNIEQIGLDFAFLTKGDLDNTYRISASVGF